jgi:hypothetical protein
MATENEKADGVCEFCGEKPPLHNESCPIRLKKRERRFAKDIARDVQDAKRKKQV